jgi:hypothetical protein
MRLHAIAPLLLAAFILAARPAAAQEVFGAVGKPDANIGIALCCFEHGTDVQAGVRTAPFASLLGGELRGQAFGSLNTVGGIDYAAAGLVLRWPLGRTLYLQPGLGAAIHDGPGQKHQATPDRLYLGSRVLFEPELMLGLHVSPSLALEAGVVHLSHAQLAGHQNPGLDDVVVRVSYRFGR